MEFIDMHEQACESKGPAISCSHPSSGNSVHFCGLVKSGVRSIRYQILTAVVLLAVFCRPAFASDLTDPLRHMSSDNILASLSELKMQEKAYLSSQYREQFLTTIGTLLSFVANYDDAIRHFDMMEPTPSSSPELTLDETRPVDALRAIRDIADKSRAIFINEAHHVPQHRAFTTLVLKALYGKGFRYFAAETLKESDKALSSRGYPLISETGFYTNEPLYGDMIRTALRLGFKVIPYESSAECGPGKEDFYFCLNLREKNQAENLYARIFKNNPGAKAIVHAGYGHIDERGGKGWNPMAKYFKEISGIDPFTIDQISMTEHSSVEYENPYYRKAVDQLHIAEPTIFKHKNDNYWVEPYRLDSYDSQVFHPRSRYEDGRPDWLLMQGSKKPVHLPQDVCEAETPCVVQAFFDHEDDSAVPADQVMITQANQQQALVLPQGKFRIKILGQRGNTLLQYAITVK